MDIETDTDLANPDLLALLGSRICHDLISPIGAIGNGVELLALSGAVQGPEMQLICESVTAAQARIRFFRMAFGAAGPGQRVARSEVEAIFAAASTGGRLSYHWQGPDQALRAEVKMIFLAILCAETALQRGGTVSVSQRDTGWRISATGPVARLEGALLARLQGATPQDAVSAAQIQFLLLPAEARRAGRTLAAHLGEGTFDVSF